jgi:site-specific DNA recombinase
MRFEACRENPSRRQGLDTYLALPTGIKALGGRKGGDSPRREAFIAKQQRRGWLCLPARYDDEGQSGVSLDRPGLQRLLADLRAGKIDYLVIYRFDRLTRSLSDLFTLVAVFEKHGTTLVSATEDLSHYPVLGLKQVEVTL